MEKIHHPHFAFNFFLIDDEINWPLKNVCNTELKCHVLLSVKVNDG